jgi:small GTP-binding protein
MSEVREFQKKIVLIGDGAVGKTSLIRRLVVDIFDDRYISTIGTKITAKDMQVKIDDKLIYLKFQIWDILGQKGYTNLFHSSFLGAHGVFFVADITRKETFDSLRTYWIPQVKEIIGIVPFIVLANKSDLVDNAEINEKGLEEFVSRYEAPFYLTSAKNGENVNNAFNKLGTNMLKFKGAPPPRIEGNGVVENIKNANAILIDRIIDDFCREYGGIENAMPILRRQFELANLDLNNPRKEDLVTAVERLADVEAGFKKIDIATANLKKRLKWIKET